MNQISLGQYDTSATISSAVQNIQVKDDLKSSGYGLNLWFEALVGSIRRAGADPYLPQALKSGIKRCNKLSFRKAQNRLTNPGIEPTSSIFEKIHNDLSLFEMSVTTTHVVAISTSHSLNLKRELKSKLRFRSAMPPAI